jgi:NAD(P)-dependent dehydrogenase (short-subunit alcohol dehydrogenase family)
MRNYLIIGASSGIGHALAKQLSTEHNVWATFNQKPAALDNVQFQQYDALSESFTLSNLPDALHGVVYCPGAINLKPFVRIKPEDFLADYQLQVVGAIKVIQGTLPALKKAGKASVVLFSTVAVQAGFGFHSIVSASKGAIEGLTRALAAEFAPSIRVNAIAPSITQTPLAAHLLGTEEKVLSNAQRHPLKEIGKPEDSAELAAFLLSEKSSWITGQIFAVDGGMSSIKM